MKRYTLRGLIHDAKIFNQLRLEYRRTKRTGAKMPPPTVVRLKRAFCPSAVSKLG